MLEIEGRERRRGNARAAICILIFAGERFHGQYREIYRAAVCDDILRVEAGGWRGPTHGGPSTSPHTFGPRGRGTGTGQASKGAAGHGDAHHNLAIIPLFIPVRPLLSAT